MTKTTVGVARSAEPERRRAIRLGAAPSTASRTVRDVAPGSAAAPLGIAAETTRARAFATRPTATPAAADGTPDASEPTFGLAPRTARGARSAACRFGPARPTAGHLTLGRAADAAREALCTGSDGASGCRAVDCRVAVRFGAVGAGSRGSAGADSGAGGAGTPSGTGGLSELG